MCSFYKVCFAYKSTVNINRLAFRVVTPFFGLSKEYSVSTYGIGDNQWHYMCGKNNFII